MRRRIDDGGRQHTDDKASHNLRHRRAVIRRVVLEQIHAVRQIGIRRQPQQEGVVIVPRAEKVKQEDGRKGGYHHRDHDGEHGLEMPRPVDERRLAVFHGNGFPARVKEQKPHTRKTVSGRSDHRHQKIVVHSQSLSDNHLHTRRAVNGHYHNNDPQQVNGVSAPPLVLGHDIGDHQREEQRHERDAERPDDTDQKHIKEVVNDQPARRRKQLYLQHLRRLGIVVEPQFLRQRERVFKIFDGGFERGVRHPEKQSDQGQTKEYKGGKRDIFEYPAERFISQSMHHTHSFTSILGAGSVFFQHVFQKEGQRSHDNRHNQSARRKIRVHDLTGRGCHLYVEKVPQRIGRLRRIELEEGHQRSAHRQKRTESRNEKGGNRRKNHGQNKIKHFLQAPFHAVDFTAFQNLVRNLIHGVAVHD